MNAMRSNAFLKLEVSGWGVDVPSGRPAEQIRKAGAGAHQAWGERTTNPSLIFTQPTFLHLRFSMGAFAMIGVSLSFLSAIWIPATLLCCIPWVQKRECAPVGAQMIGQYLTGHRDVVSALGDILPRQMADGT
jgi:hypothetical protein